MNQFYISLIFIGIILIMISLISILYDKKSSADYAGRIEAKKKELEEVISDAEIMIQEMNKFSEYLVTQVENKYSEISNDVYRIKNKAEHIHGSTKQEREDLSSHSVMYITENRVEEAPVSDKATFDDEVSIPVEDSLTKEAPVTVENPAVKNNKYSKVIMLSKEGLGTAEIAKKLGMGQGEIQLILDINK